MSSPSQQQQEEEQVYDDGGGNQYDPPLADVMPGLLPEAEVSYAIGSHPTTAAATGSGGGGGSGGDHPQHYDDFQQDYNNNNSNTDDFQQQEHYPGGGGGDGGGGIGHTNNNNNSMMPNNNTSDHSNGGGTFGTGLSGGGGGSAGGTLGADNDNNTVERLYTILEAAVPRQDDVPATGMTAEEIQRRREFEEQCWDQVRKWLWTHESPEDRATAMLVRGQGDVTPLHLICKLNNPPTDIINELVLAAPEVVGIPDSHGWLPLHHACAAGAGTEVLELLTSIHPESKIAQDNQSRTPLHFYATRNGDNPNQMAANVALLCDTGAAQLPDRGGMIPLHYACTFFLVLMSFRFVSFRVALLLMLFCVV